jgi:NADH-quinone oxidoreductase subunit E
VFDRSLPDRTLLLRGSDEIVEYLEKKLGIKNGETTGDGMFSIKTVECLGSCGTAPMLQCGAKYYEELTPEKVVRCRKI